MAILPQDKYFEDTVAQNIENAKKKETKSKLYRRIMGVPTLGYAIGAIIWLVIALVTLSLLSDTPLF